MKAIPIDALKSAYSHKPPRIAALAKKYGMRAVRRAAVEAGLVASRSTWTDQENAILLADRRPGGRTWAACAKQARLLGYTPGSDASLYGAGLWEPEEDRLLLSGYRPGARSFDSCSRRASALARRATGTGHV